MAQSITTYAGGKSPRQIVWDAIRLLHAQGSAAWTQTDIQRAIPKEARREVTLSIIRKYCWTLTLAGMIRVTNEPAGFTTTCYALVKDEGMEAPRLARDGTRITRGLPQEQMWRSLRLLPGDTNARELAAYASTREHAITVRAAAQYLRVLYRAAYLVAGPVRGRYRLRPHRDTGPRPPVSCRAQVVYDPNEDKIVWIAPVSEEDAP